jgi:hypothetical protein
MQSDSRLLPDARQSALRDSFGAAKTTGES